MTKTAGARRAIVREVIENLTVTITELPKAIA